MASKQVIRLGLKNSAEIPRHGVDIYITTTTLSIDFVKPLADNCLVRKESSFAPRFGSFDMAENESLDLGKTPRWKRVHRAVINREPLDTVVQKARESLCRTLRNLMKIIPFDQLLSAACNDRDSVRDLIRQCNKGREFAQLFYVVSKPGMCRRDVCQACFDEICDEYIRQIESNSFPSEQWQNLPDLRHYLSEVREQLGYDTAKFSDNFTEDPNWRPRIPRSRNRSTATADLMKESLLSVSRK